MTEMIGLYARLAAGIRLTWKKVRKEKAKIKI